MKLTTRLAATVVVAALAPSAALAAPRPVADVRPSAPLAAAQVLEAQWGRCPTARPALALVAVAERPDAPSIRLVRARVALRAFRIVAAECSKPVPMPSVVLPPSDGPVLPAAVVVTPAH